MQLVNDWFLFLGTRDLCKTRDGDGSLVGCVKLLTAFACVCRTDACAIDDVRSAPVAATVAESVVESRSSFCKVGNVVCRRRLLLDAVCVQNSTAKRTEHTRGESEIGLCLLFRHPSSSSASVIG